MTLTALPQSDILLDAQVPAEPSAMRPAVVVRRATGLLPLAPARLRYVLFPWLDPDRSARRGRCHELRVVLHGRPKEYALGGSVDATLSPLDVGREEAPAIDVDARLERFAESIAKLLWSNIQELGTCR